MVERKAGRLTKNSYPMTQSGLRAEDVRQVSKVLRIPDEQALTGLMWIGIRGADIQSLQARRNIADIRDGVAKVGRREAARKLIEYLTSEQVERLMGVEGRDFSSRR